MNYHPPTGEASEHSIAIVGMACRFPGAGDPRALWRLLLAGEHALREVPPDRWPAADYVDADRRAPAKMVTARGGFLDAVDGFDAAFFGVSAREAVQVDPQQRLALELAWESLEDAGIAPDELRGSNTGVFLGAMWTDYARLHTISAIEQHSGTGWHLGVVPGRVSYALGLRGPSMAVNTACSSSLVAVHLACKALLDGETSLALAGGVSLMLAPHVGVAMSKFGGTSASGRCHAYDARADGYVRGEGGGVVALRRYADARAAGERIIAVIHASAVNNDGHGPGLTVPEEDAQRSLLREVYGRAGVDPRTVVFVEGHGTGTPVGDPIEARALGAELGGRARRQPLWLGSIKPNIGHTEAASGVASLIKTALALREGVIPPNRNFSQPNPAIDFEGLRLRVPTRPQPWTGPRLAGVNSFGFGGTNCHLVLAADPDATQAPEPEPASASEPEPEPAPRLILVTARDAGALDQRLRSLHELAARAQAPGALDDLAHTLWHRRAHLEQRAFACVSSMAELRAQLEAGELQRREHRGDPPRLVLAFSGQGSQWPAMGRELLAHEPAFAASLRRCAQLMLPMIGWDVHAAIAADELGPRLEYVDGIQPAIFALQVALADTWAALGIRPAAVVGHSMGEVAAAVAAGAITVEDGAHITCTRARLLRRISGRGGMLSLSRAAAEVEALLARAPQRYAGLGVAVDGGAGSTVVSGGLEALARLRADLERPRPGDQGPPIEVREVAVDVAAHSPQIDALSAEFLAELQGVSSRPSEVRMLSSVTGGPVDYRDLTPAYWVANLRQRVRFAEAAGALLDEGFSLFLEPSPHPLLTWPLGQMAKARGLSEVRAFGCMRRARSDRAQLLEAAGWLKLHGHAPRLEQAGRLLELPPYPWQRRRFWPRAQPERARSTEAELSVSFKPERIPALSAHRVDGRATLSAGVCLELSLRALELLEPGADLRVHELEFRAPVAGDAPVRLELHALEGGLGLSVLDEDAQLGARARLEILDTEARLGAPRPDRLTAERDGARHYARLREQGVDYDEALMGVRALALGPGVARVHLRAGISRAALLDACFQAALVACDERQRAGERLVVARLASATLRPDQLERASLIHARITALGDARHEAEAEAWLLDEAGQALVHLRGIELVPRPAEASVLRRRGWRPQPLPPPPSRPRTRRVLFVLPDEHERAVALADALERVGPACGLELRRGTLAELELAEDIDTLVWPALAAPEPEGAELVERGARACAAMLELLRRVAGRPRDARPRVVLLSERALALERGARVALGGSALHGLARVARAELPELALQQIDLGPLEPERAPDQLQATALALAEELAAAGSASALALRWSAASRRCERLAPTLEPVPTPARAWRPRAGSVIVSGGLGGIGRAVVRDLAERGVERLLLLGRRALTPEARDSLAQLEAQTGAQLRYLQVDVADGEALERALADERARVVGIIHAAAALSDAPLLAHQTEHFRAALRPKLGGAWNLHQLSAGLELDFFVLFGSLGGWFGLPGQASYAAANAALDGLAAHRQALGLPATSVGWCGWSGLGFARSAGGSASLDRLAAEGVASLEPGAALELCASLLDARSLPPAIAVMPPLDEHAASSAPPVETGSQRAALAAMAPAQRREAVRALVLREAATVLRDEPAQVDPRRALRELGLDSLMTVELGERLARSLGLEGATTLLWKYPSVEALAAHALTTFVARPTSALEPTENMLAAGRASPPPHVQAAAGAPVDDATIAALADELADELGDELGDLSDEEVEALTRVL